MPSNESSSKAIRLLGFVVVIWCCFFHQNEVFEISIMEARNLVTAKEMVHDGNWLVPTMNGELRLEKPPLPTWIAAGIEIVAPHSIRWQRAAAGCAAILMMIFLWRLALLLTQRRGLADMAAMILATSYFILFLGRSATWDIYAHAFMLGGIFYMHRGLTEDRRVLWRMLLSGLLMGLSFLSKGPIAFYALLLPYLLVVPWLYTISWRQKIWPLTVLVVITALLSAWWPVYLMVAAPEQLAYVATKETGAWMSKHVRPWYYYWSFTVQSGVWTLFFAAALFWPLTRKRTKPAAKSHHLAIAWVLASVVLLSVFPEKKSRFLMPVLIPGALATAHYLYFTLRAMRRGELSRGEQVFLNIVIYLKALILLMAPVGIYILAYLDGHIGVWTTAQLAITLWALALLLLRAYHMKWSRTLFFSVVSITLVICTLGLPVIKTFVFNPQLNSIRALREISTIQQMSIYAHPELRIEQIYEIGRPVSEWDDLQEPLPMDELPIVLVTMVEPECFIDEETLSRIEIEYIDRFNDNKKPKGHKRYAFDQERYVSIVRHREN